MSDAILNQTKFFKNSDSSRELFYQTFQSKEQDHKACLMITHGQGEHSEAYRELAVKICTKLPVKVFAWDLVGHGKSSGQRGYVGDISWLTKDFTTAFKLFKESSDKAPFFLLSHSLGGLLHLYAEHEGLINTAGISGSIFSNPCVSLNFTPPKWKTLGAEFLTKIAPRVTLGNELNPSQLASDPEYLEAFKNDPLRHNSISPRFYLGMLKLMESLDHRKATHPTLALLSSKDSVCDSSKSKAYLKETSDILSFEKSGHEVLNDIEKDVAINSITDFIFKNYQGVSK